MKKILITLIFTFSLCPLGFAQYDIPPLPGVEVLAREIFKQIPQPKTQPKPYVVQKNIEETYKTTVQTKLPMTEAEYIKLYNRRPIVRNPETKKTDNYKQATINIPYNYVVYDLDADVNKKGVPYLRLSNNMILVTINGEDLSFKLDYEIHFAKQSDEEEFLKTGCNYNFANKPLKVIINYAPKYFTLKKVNNYETNQTVPVVYKDKNIILNTVTLPVLYLEDKKGDNLEFVLEPNFQNLYNDFKFIREGHKKVEFVDVK